MMLVYINRVVGVRDPKMMDTGGYKVSRRHGVYDAHQIHHFWLLQVTANLNLLFEIFI